MYNNKGSRPDQVTGVRGQLIPEFHQQTPKPHINRRPSQPRNPTTRTKPNIVARAVNDFQNIINQHSPIIDQFRDERFNDYIKNHTYRQKPNFTIPNRRNANTAQTQHKTRVQQRRTSDGVTQPTILWHGTSKQAAEDIFYNQRVIKGQKEAFWMAEKMEDAKSYANGRDPQNGRIIKIWVDPSVEMSHHYLYWNIPMNGLNSRKAYRFKGVRPLAMFDLNGNKIA